MEFADLLANLGGSELSKEEKKRAVKWGLLNMGAGMLANNRGNYGDFAPALGAGLNQGLLGYQTQLGREEAGAKKRKQTELMQNAFKAAMTPGQSFQQIGSQGNSYITGDRTVADMITGQNQSINELNAMPVEPPVQTFGMGFTPPPVGMMTEGSEMPFNANRSRIPGQNITRPPEPMTEAEQGLYGMTPVPPPQTPSATSAPMLPTDYQSFSTPEQFDMLKAARQLMQSGDPELMQSGFQIYAGLKGGKDERTAEMKNYEFLSSLPAGEAEKFMGLLTNNKDDRTSQIKNFEYAIQRGYRGSFDDFMIMTAEAQARIMAPYRQSEMQSRERRDEYELPPAGRQQQSFSVTAPNGKTYSFPSAADADKFRRSLGGQ